MKNFLLFFLLSFFIEGVFGESVSVTEGDSVTLRTGLTEIQRDDVIEWRFGAGLDRIARVRKDYPPNTYDDALNWKYRGRLKLDNQTGDLTIRNTKTMDTGNYEVSTNTLKRTFIFSVVAVDAVKSVSVLVGESVTLHTDIPDVQRYDVMQWRFEHQNSFLAKINRNNRSISISDDKRFRHRLQLDYLTGSLTINHIGTNHSGLYEVDISSSSRHTIHKKFSVTVSGELKSVSVMQGDSVLLGTDDTELQIYDFTVWMFGDTVLAEIYKAESVYTYRDDNKFRLTLDKDTGSLTIRNITTTNSGLYEQKISSSRRAIQKKFLVTVTDGAKSVSLNAGDSATLLTVIEIQNDDLIQWMFENTVIAEIRKAGQGFHTYNGPDGRFRGRLKLNNQTGSLTITNTRTTDSGDYELKISSSRRNINRRFTVTVTEPGWTTLHKLIFGVLPVFSVAAVIGCCCCRKIIKLEKIKRRTVAVMEGTTAPLHVNAIKILEEYCGYFRCLTLTLKWMFGNTLIAESKVVGGKITTLHVLDERFRDRLKLHDQTGSLNITNTKTEDSGVYHLKINRFLKITLQIFEVHVLAKKDEIQSVSEMIMHPVILESGETEVNRNDEILWMFGLNKPLAQIKGGKISYPINSLKGKLKLNNTGSLTINNTSITDSGFYVLQILRSGHISRKIFLVQISDPSEMERNNPEVELLSSADTSNP